MFLKLVLICLFTRIFWPPFFVFLQICFCDQLLQFLRLDHRRFMHRFSNQSGNENSPESWCRPYQSSRACCKTKKIRLDEICTGSVKGDKSLNEFQCVLDYPSGPGNPPQTPDHCCIQQYASTLADFKSFSSGMQILIILKRF